MNHTYTSVPPTDDEVYWLLKSEGAKTRVFVPRDKDLHRQLLIAQRSRKAATTAYANLSQKSQVGRSGR